MNKTLPIIVITGPTASGKTTLAIELAKKIGAEIICADSRIVYKNFNIVSAKPAPKEQSGVVHHLIDIKEPNSKIYSAGDFVQDAEKIIEKAKTPIIIQGGTWFYIKSLLDDKALPEFGINEEFRAGLARFSNDELWEKLNLKDSKRALLIHKNNRDKVIRSLELIEALNAPISSYKRAENKKYNAVWFMKNIEREELYKKINLRVDLMVKQGLYEEWLENRKKYGDIELLKTTIGYREFFEFEDFNFAVEKIKQRTRNFAKRQLTWFNQNEINFADNIEDIMKKSVRVLNQG